MSTETEYDQYDLIDELIDALNDGVPEITFDRDVIDTNRPEDWAAVELSGQDDAEWADGELIDQSLTADIWVCVSDRGSGVKRRVQSVLRDLCPEKQIGWRLASRAYLYDLDKVMWRWILSIDGPLVVPEEDEDPDPEDQEPAEQEGD